LSADPVPDGGEVPTGPVAPVAPGEPVVPLQAASSAQSNPATDAEAPCKGWLDSRWPFAPHITELSLHPDNGAAIRQGNSARVGRFGLAPHKLTCNPICRLYVIAQRVHPRIE
jgi:hypothetical protein